MIDLTFRNIERLFVPSFKNGANNPTTLSFDRFYMSLVEVKDFNVLIDNKPFFDQTVKTNKKHMKNSSKCQEMMTTTENLLDYLYHQKYYKLIYQDKQVRLFLNKVNVTGKLEEGNGATLFFIAERQQNISSKLFF